MTHPEWSEPQPDPSGELDAAHPQRWDRVRQRGKLAFILGYGIVGLGVPLALLVNLAILRARGDWDLLLSAGNAFELTFTLLLVAPVAGVILGHALWARLVLRVGRPRVATIPPVATTAVMAPERRASIAPRPRAEGLDGLVRIAPPKMRACGAADEIFHRALVEDARNRVLYAVVACVGAVALWGWVGEFALHSFTFFAVGLALLWAYSVVTQYRALRDTSASAVETPEQATRAAEHAAWAERHQALRASRPPRMTYGLLGCITIASVLQVAAHGRSVEAAGIVKSAVRDQGQWWRLLTGTYLHAGLWHFWMNAGALEAFGADAEAYAPRLRLPLAYLVAALTGSVASLVLSPNRNSVGASGGILGVAAFLLVLALRRPEEVPPWLRRGMLMTFALTAYLGFFGLAFIDNAAHAGGALGGALVGLAAVPPAGVAASADRNRILDALGIAACAVLVAGTLYAAARLLAA